MFQVMGCSLSTGLHAYAISSCVQLEAWMKPNYTYMLSVFYIIFFSKNCTYFITIEFL